MKKALIVLALIVLVVVPVMAKKGATAIGGEAGYPATGVTFRFDMNDKLNGFATAGFWYYGGIEALVGAEYKVAQFKIGNEDFYVCVGGEAGAMVAFNKDVKAKVIAAAEGSLNWDFTINNNADFTVYLRLGPGVGFTFKEDGVHIGPDFIGALGLVYYF